MWSVFSLPWSVSTQDATEQRGGGHDDRAKWPDRRVDRASGLVASSDDVRASVARDARTCAFPLFVEAAASTKSGVVALHRQAGPCRAQHPRGERRAT